MVLLSAGSALEGAREGGREESVRLARRQCTVSGARWSVLWYSENGQEGGREGGREGKRAIPRVRNRR